MIVGIGFTGGRHSGADGFTGDAGRGATARKSSNDGDGLLDGSAGVGGRHFCAPEAPGTTGGLRSPAGGRDDDIDRGARHRASYDERGAQTGSIHTVCYFDLLFTQSGSN